MNVNHIALWVRNLSSEADFYCKYFSGTAGPEYSNVKRGFRSCFISFDSGARVELMHMASIVDRPTSPSLGWNHIAFSVGSKERVDMLTESIRANGHEVASEPRTTGDGYYESVVLDPEGNSIEITV
jgi:lactoylglutathione lyase